MAQFKQSPEINISYESPYKLKWQKDAPLLGASLALTVSQIINKNKTPLTHEYVNSLNSGYINSFDRAATYQYSHKAQVASDFLFFGSMSAPVLLMADSKIRNDWKEVSLIAAETYLVGMGLTMLGKNLSTRARPFLYNPDIPIEDKLSPDGTNSFFSGHTSMTALSTFMMAKIITDYHPDTKLKPLIWTTATVIPLTTGMLRYRAGKHYFTDILAGFTVGALTGYLIPHMHKSIARKRNKGDIYTIDHSGEKIKVKDFFVDSVVY